MIIYKKTAISQFVRFVVGVTFLSTLSVSYAGEVCPAINCDCSSLPNEAWQLICSSHEVSIKDKCAKNSNKPTNFCSLHGPSAHPLPIAVELAQVKILPEENIKQVHKLTDTIYWSLKADMRAASILINNGSFGEAQETLKIIDRNLDSLFTQQRQVTMSFEMNDDYGSAVSAWKGYSKQTTEEAEDMLALGEKLWSERNGDPKRSKAYRILSMKVLRMASKAYEMAAYSFSSAKKDDDAAKAWRDAADVSRVIMEHKMEDKAPAQHIGFYRQQAAMRLHRASYHWMMDKEEQDAKVSLQASVEFMDNKRQLDRLLKDDAAEPAAEEAVANSEGGLFR